MGARNLGTFDFGIHYETVNVILACDKRGLQQNLHEQTGQVATQQLSFDYNLAVIVYIFVRLGAFLLSFAFQDLCYFFLLVEDVQNVAEVQKRRRGHKDDLYDPEANVGDGKGVIVAHVFTAGLFGVADHF